MVQQEIHATTKEDLYLVKLRFSSPMVGAGSLNLEMTVEAASGAINGTAEGTLMAGTQSPPTFHAVVSGHEHSTGLGDFERVGAATGQATVSSAPPRIGTYLAPCTISFAVDKDWNGKGKFSVGDHSYECEVTKL